MTIRTKLVLAFFANAILVAAVGYVATSTNHTINAQVKLIGSNSLLEYVDATEMNLALITSHLAAYKALDVASTAPAHSDVQPTPTTPPGTEQLPGTEHELAISAYLSTFRRNLERSRSASHALAESTRADGRDAITQRLTLNRLNYLEPLARNFEIQRKLLNKFVSLANQDSERAAQLLRGPAQIHFQNEMQPLIESYKRDSQREFTNGIRTVERAIDSANQFNQIATSISLLSSLLFGLLIAESVGRPLGILRDAALQLGKGSLSNRIEIKSRDEIGVLAAAFNQMVLDLQASTVSNAYFNNILQSMREMLIVVGSDLRIKRINPAALVELGYSANELLGQPLAIIFANSQAPAEDTSQIQGVAERNLLSKSGELIPVHYSAASLLGADGGVQGMVCVALNISERKQAAEQMRASLVEKEILLREVHHRVKNNLQIISSLLQMQARDSADPEVVRLLVDSDNRIRSMAIVHEQLYQSSDLGAIDFGGYVNVLSQHLTQYAIKPIAVHVDVENIALALNQAIPCGMIVNELVSNSIEHAFQNQPNPAIYVSFKSDNRFHELTIRDNGRGMSGDSSQQSSLGLTIVRALVKQLHGELRVSNESGATFTVSFAIPQPSKASS